MRSNPGILVLILALTACPSGSAEREASPAAAGDTKATAFSLPFVHDDYGAALVLARERDLPLFVESWAPW